MAEFIGQVSYEQLFALRKPRLIDKTPIALVQGKRLFRRNRAHGITIPQQRLQLRELGRNNH
ncbi:MAG: hypothetical protein J0I79_24760 [Mesorhizobium sp.]|nr:hypothetical protein [Mesorhizobium sp.]